MIKIKFVYFNKTNVQYSHIYMYIHYKACKIQINDNKLKKKEKQMFADKKCRVGETGVGELGIGEMGVGEMGVLRRNGTKSFL